MFERNLQRAIIDKILKPKGYWYLNTFGKPRKGIPDLIICINGNLVGMELKRPGSKPTKLQEYELDWIKKAGGIKCIIHSIDEAREKIKEIECQTI